MSPVIRVLVVVAILVLLWFVLTSALRSRSRAPRTFTPVAQLPPEERAVIDAAIDRGEGVAAIRHYRAATGAGLAAAKAAVETHRDTRRT